MDRNWIFGLCRKMSVQESICACAAFCIANSAELLLSKAGLLCTLHYCMDFLSNPLNSTLMSDAKKNPTNFFLDISQEIFSFLIFNFGARVLVLPEQNEFLIFFVSDFILQHYNGHAKSSKYAFFHKIDFGPTKNLVKQEFVKKIRKFR